MTKTKPCDCGCITGQVAKLKQEVIGDPIEEHEHTDDYCGKPRASQSIEQWEVDFSNWMTSHNTFMGGLSSNLIPALKQFIRTQLDKAKEEARREPMGVSQWAEHGKKYGYWDFFENNNSKALILKTQHEQIQNLIKILDNTIKKD